MEILSNQTFRLIIMAVLIIFLIFYGAYFRRIPKGKQENELNSKIGRCIHVIAVFNAAVLFLVEYMIENWGNIVFFVSYIVLLILDIVVVIMSLKKKNNK